MKKTKLNKKGVSLCEVLVAMTIFAIAALLLASMVCVTTKMNKQNHLMNKQMEQQGKAVEEQDPTKIRSTTPDELQIDIDGSSFKYDINKHDTGTSNDYSDFKYFN